MTRGRTTSTGRSQDNAFSHMAVLRPSAIRLNIAGVEQSVARASVTNSYFGLFGCEPIIGGGFTDAEIRVGLTAVVSYGLWQHYLSVDRNTLGRPSHFERPRGCIGWDAPVSVEDSGRTISDLFAIRGKGKQS